MRLTGVFVFCLLAGCTMQTTADRWAAAGHPLPDLMCLEYSDASNNPDPVLYLYYSEPHSGRITLKSAEIVNATYQLTDTTREWMWGTDDRNGTFAYNITVTANGHGYYYDFTAYPEDQGSIDKKEDYLCEAFR